MLRLRESGKNVRLVAAVPFRGMEKSWDDDWKKRYKSVIDKSNQVVIISNTLCRAAFFQRNHFMVDHASRLLAVYSGGGGGTLETMNYAEKKKIEVIKYSK